MKKFNEFKNTTAVKNFIRETLFNDTLEFFKSKYGEDRVSIVGKNQIAIGIEDIEMSDSTVSELVGVIKPIAKEFTDRTTDSGKTIEIYDRLSEVEIYDIERKEKEEKARKKKEETEKKKAKDKAEREKKQKEEKEN